MKLNKKGFTLVELLAVIVILALLMVVATRTIGSNLEESRKSAMKTEAQKVVSRTYEDLQSQKLIGSGTLSYPNVTSTGASEGDYTIKITLDASDSYTMSSVCIKYGDNKYGSGTITGNTINWGAEDANLYTSTNCMGS